MHTHHSHLGVVQTALGGTSLPLRKTTRSRAHPFPSLSIPAFQRKPQNPPNAVHVVSGPRNQKISSQKNGATGFALKIASLLSQTFDEE